MPAVPLRLTCRPSGPPSPVHTSGQPGRVVPGPRLSSGSSHTVRTGPGRGLRPTQVRALMSLFSRVEGRGSRWPGTWCPAPSVPSPLPGDLQPPHQAQGFSGAQINLRWRCLSSHTWSNCAVSHKSGVSRVFYRCCCWERFMAGSPPSVCLSSPRTPWALAEYPPSLPVRAPGLSQDIEPRDGPAGSRVSGARGPGFEFHSLFLPRPWASSCLGFLAHTTGIGTGDGGRGRHPSVGRRISRTPLRCTEPQRSWGRAPRHLCMSCEPSEGKQTLTPRSLRGRCYCHLFTGGDTEAQGVTCLHPQMSGEIPYGGQHQHIFTLMAWTLEEGAGRLGSGRGPSPWLADGAFLLTMSPQGGDRTRALVAPLTRK